jgi:hypothetical protein
VLAWATVLVSAAAGFYLAWTDYPQPDRPEGTIGHLFIDFAGQWIMGRMLARHEGPYLYEHERVHEALLEAYGREDGDRIIGFIIEAGDRPGVGGPLYPPIHALLFYPLGFLTPVAAYRATQVINMSLTFIIGFLFCKLTRGRIWASVATGAVMAFPGYNGSVCLGQNALWSVALLVLGWLLISRNRPLIGGVCWGLLAFKPVWAAAFFLVPLLSRRWRVCAAMLLTGLALVLLTLPFVGLQSWFDWLAVGREASAGYARYETWIFLSRDLQNIPRRWMLNFADGVATDADQSWANLIGLALWLTVIALTVLLALWRWRRPAGLEGPPVAFLMLGAWLSCYHFMYYDVVLALLPASLIFMKPARSKESPDLRPSSWLLRNAVPLTLLALLFALPHIADGIDYLRTGGHPIYHSPPFDTFCVLGLWAWCGWQWLRSDNEG